MYAVKYIIDGASFRNEIEDFKGACAFCDIAMEQGAVEVSIEMIKDSAGDGETSCKEVYQHFGACFQDLKDKDVRRYRSINTTPVLWEE
jgi:hypothetical protein